MASSKFLKNLRNVEDLQGLLNDYAEYADLSRWGFFIINYGEQIVHKGSQFCKLTIKFIENSGVLTAETKTILANLKQWDTMMKKINAKGRHSKEYVTPLLKVLAVPKRKQHQCIIEGCEDGKNFSFRCGVGPQCRMKVDPKLHQSVPFFAKWLDQESEEVICAFCVRGYVNPLFLAASDAFYYLRSLDLHTDYYVSFNVPVSGPKISCCNCKAKEGDFNIQSLSCLSPVKAWHAYCMDCMAMHYNNTSACENCGFDLKEISADYCQLLF